MAATQGGAPQANTQRLPASEMDSPTGSAPPNLTVEILENLEYPLPYARSGRARLTGGEFREPAAPGAAAETTIKLSQFISFGNIAGEQFAAVVLISETGGSGTFYDLALVSTKVGKPTILDTEYLGDRIVIESLQIVDDGILLEMFEQGPEDSMASPNQYLHNKYILKNNKLELGKSEKIASDNADSLTGTVWFWTRFSDPLEAFDVPEPGNYTLEFFEGGTLQINADCNSAAGSYTAGGGSIDIKTGPATLAQCSPDSLGDRFIQNLGFARIYFFQNGELFIDLFADGGTMKFTASGS